MLVAAALLASSARQGLRPVNCPVEKHEKHNSGNDKQHYPTQSSDQQGISGVTSKGKEDTGEEQRKNPDRHQHQIYPVSVYHGKLLTLWDSQNSHAFNIAASGSGSAKR